MKDDGQVLPPPRPLEHFNNTGSRMERREDRRTSPYRDRKPFEQWNTQLRPGLKDEIAKLQREVAVEKNADFTRGEFVEMLVLSFRAHRQQIAKLDALLAAGAGDAPSVAALAKAVDGYRQASAVDRVLAQSGSSQPPAADLARDRVHRVEIWLSEDAVKELQDAMAVRGWTAGGVVEDTMTTAAKAMRELRLLKAEIDGKAAGKK